MEKTNRLKIAYYLNIALVVLGIAGLICSIGEQKLGLFAYYTQDSNIFGMISSLVYVVTGYAGFRAGDYKASEFVAKFRYMATCCMCLTFLVVIFVLTPLAGFKWFPWYLFHGANLFYHTICPILSFISFVFFEDIPNLRFKNSAINAIPTVLYAIVTIILNATGKLYGPYPFLLVREQSILMSVIWFIVIVGGSWVIAILIYFLKKKMLRRNG